MAWSCFARGIGAMLVLTLAVGCECSAGTGATCAVPCGGGDAASGECPSGFMCIDECCRCTPVAEVCDGMDSDCDLRADDGVENCACAPEGPGPSAETCNGIDDDCNGMIDDGLPPADEVCDGEDQDCDGTADDGLDPMVCPCAPGGVGRGDERCNGVDDDCDGIADDGLEATCACAPGGPGPSAETCNGIDDDCDGVVDGGLEATCACAPGGPERGPEICNGLDDDCNGLIEDGVMLCGRDTACACAPGGPGASIEVCNGVDDDCNDMVDDGLMGCGCAGCAMPGATEICNRLDDDCDGTADEDVPACACAPGGPGPSMEICNGIDDDCDGTVDDAGGPMGSDCRGFGEPCASNAECSSMLCVGDAFEMYCSRPCAMVGDPGDCPATYRCFDNPSMGGSDHCRRNYARCRRDADCAAGEVCAATCDDRGATAITECRPAIAGGAAAPGTCMRATDCASHDCFRTRFCTEVCASDADCSVGHRCVLVPYGACGGGDYIARCLDACDCDAECPAGQYCQPYVHEVLPPAMRTTVGACDIGYGTLGPGEDCDNTAMPPRTCVRAICSRSGTGFCTQVCSTTCGCPAGIGPCRASTVTFPDLGPFPAMTCDTL